MIYKKPYLIQVVDNFNLGYLIIVLIFFVFQSCDQARVIESESNKKNNATAITPNNIPALQEMDNKDAPTATLAHNHPVAVHQVVAEDQLHTDKYTYIKVDENGEKFWVAISKSDVKIGETYYFNEGLLKKNFYSQEFDRVFETIYLVSKIWQKNTSENSQSGLENAVTRTKAGAALNMKVGKIEPAEGGITIAELFNNKEKYRNQKVRISGICVKLNPRIMGRNWAHLQDGSGENLDLTVTTQQDIQLGALATLEGIISLDRDFGAGYRYDIIMEQAVLR